MSNSRSIWKWIGASVLVIVVGGGVGFYLSGPSKVEPSSNPSPSPTPVSSSADQNKQQGATQVAGDYTAPGAPRVEILEEKVDLSRKSTNDVDNSTSPADNANSQDSTQTDQNQPQASPNPNDQDSSPQGTGSPASPQTAPSPDAAPNSNSTPTPAQPPASPISAPSSQPSNAETSAHIDNALYRVMVGSAYQTQKGALVLAGDLRHKGYIATTARIAGRTGSSYRVQVGAFHSRSSAEDLMNQLQQNGYAANVSNSK